MKRGLYSIAILATRRVPGATQIQMTALATDAASEDEARGWGLRMARERWPAADEWEGHDVVAAAVKANGVPIQIEVRP